MGAKIGGFVYPSENKEFGCECEEIGTVKNNINHIASIYKYGFLIANKKSNEENFNNIKEFAKEIKTSEDNFKEKIENKFQ